MKMIKRLAALLSAVIIAAALMTSLKREDNLTGAFGENKEEKIEENNVNTFVFGEKAEGCPMPTASASVLVEAKSGEVLFELNAHERLPMASTTKLMTAIVVCERMPLDRVITVGRESVGIEGSSMYLFEGEKITVETLLYGLLLESANDAATALAMACAGSVEAFAGLMNEKAREMGLENTNFTNPHGLDHEEHYTTALELAKIGIKALENETIAGIVSSRSHKAAVIGKNGTRHMVNHNRLLYTYNGAVGLKTGFTKRTGRCLVSAAERDGMTLVCVTLHAVDDWNAHRRMLDFGFENYKMTKFIPDDGDGFGVDCIGGESERVMTRTEGALFILSRKEDDLSSLTFSTRIIRPIFAPVAEGKRLGQLDFYKDGEFLCALPIVSTEENPERADKRNVFQKIRDYFSSLFTF